MSRDKQFVTVRKFRSWCKPYFVRSPNVANRISSAGPLCLGVCQVKRPHRAHAWAEVSPRTHRGARSLRPMLSGCCIRRARWAGHAGGRVLTGSRRSAREREVSLGVRRHVVDTGYRLVQSAGLLVARIDQCGSRVARPCSCTRCYLAQRGSSGTVFLHDCAHREPGSCEPGSRCAQSAYRDRDPAGALHRK